MARETVQKSITIPVELDRALVERAALEQRTYSNVVAVYLTSDLAVPVVMAARSVEEPAVEAVSPVAEPAARKATVSSGRARTQTCVHRVPAGAFCKACDS